MEWHGIDNGAVTISGTSKCHFKCIKQAAETGEYDVWNMWDNYQWSHDHASTIKGLSFM